MWGIRSFVRGSSVPSRGFVCLVSVEIRLIVTRVRKIFYLVPVFVSIVKSWVSTDPFSVECHMFLHKLVRCLRTWLMTLSTNRRIIIILPVKLKWLLRGPPRLIRPVSRCRHVQGERVVLTYKGWQVKCPFVVGIRESTTDKSVTFSTTLFSDQLTILGHTHCDPV